MPNVGKTRDQGGTLLRKDQARPLVERMVKANCFLCDGSHWVQDCPEKKAFNAMIEEKEKEGNAYVGSVQLLNTLKAKLVPKTPQSK